MNRHTSAPPPFWEIIVKFREGDGRELSQDAQGRLVSRSIDLTHFNQTLNDLRRLDPDAMAGQSFPETSRRLKALDPDAIYTRGRKRVRLDLFVRVMISSTVADQKQWIARFRGDDEVRYAVLAGRVRPAQTQDYTEKQGYLEQAYLSNTSHGGIDARYAWRVLPGGEGSTVTVCVHDKSYNEKHEDLLNSQGLPKVPLVPTEPSLTLPPGNGSLMDHGTKSLGVVAAEKNGMGVTGICHAATFYFLPWNKTTPKVPLDDLAGAQADVEIDVLLIELDLGVPNPDGEGERAVPLEHDPDVRARFMLGEDLKLSGVICEPAGNGYLDLGTVDGFDVETGDQVTIWSWEPGGRGPENETVAIIVGAGSRDLPHTRMHFSNYGFRVDCQGWGEGVATTGDTSDDLHDGGTDENGERNANYTGEFDGTSSATAVVAGVVACLQSVLRAVGRPTLTSDEMRSLLRKPQYGTPQPSYDPATGAAVPGSEADKARIGPLPDLSKLLCSQGICPDVYLRDNLEDIGDEPNTGITVARSPDIITRRSLSEDPQAAFGLAEWGNDLLVQEVARGQDNYVYARMHNRGNAPDDVTVTAYWTEAGAFLHPAYWKEIGTVTVPDVAAGEHRVSDTPITWPDTAIPQAGDYCLIAVLNRADLGSVRDAVNVPTAFTSTGDFLTFVRDHNNVSFRNIKVVDLARNELAAYYQLLLRGLPEKRAVFRFEILTRLPLGSEIELAIPPRAILRVTDVERTDPLHDWRPGRPLRWKNPSKIVLDNILLREREEVEVTVKVELPPRAKPGEYAIAIDQYLDATHLGRANLLIRAPRPV